MENDIKVSVIIVNYNVKDFIVHAIQSLQRALNKIPHEIFVVDNASVDGSVQMIRSHFPQINLIENKKNIGFSAANNIALKKASGEYLVLLNPDTVVQEDTFTGLIAFMEKTPDAGAATCKILNPNGSFSLDSRHSIPTPLTAIWKILGLSRLFPKSKIFGRYNLTYLDQNDTYPVDAISGSFMMIRRRTFEQVGYLDEDFFMYCEDVDYCYRILKEGWKIYYVPVSNIIHYKGESTKKYNFDYVFNFNKSLYLFYKKHFQQKYITLFRWIILLGVFMRGVIIFIKNFFSANFVAITDLILLNVVIFLTFVVRFEIKSAFTFSNFVNLYIVINGLATVIFLAVAYALDLYGRFKFSLVQIFKTNFISFFVLSGLTFFLNQFAFSRIVVVISAIFSTLAMIFWRIVLRSSNQTIPGTMTQDIFQKKTVLVGTDSKTENLVGKLKNQVHAGSNIVGLVSILKNDVGKIINGLPVVACLEQLDEYARMEKINQIIFLTHNIEYQLILKTMSRMDNAKIEFKIVPENLEIIIGKSLIERLDDYPLVDIDYAIGKTINRLNKRLFDIFVSFFSLALTFPIWIFALLSEKKYYEIWDGKGKKLRIIQTNKKPFHGVINNLFLLLSVFWGKMSVGGAPIRLKKEKQPVYFYKPGITGLLQINRYRIDKSENEERFELFYLKHQSIWLDLEIILKSLFSKNGNNKK